MSKQYEPELGQMCFGNAYGNFEAGDLGGACVEAVLSEIDRVFGNTKESEWDRFDDPEIAGVEYHSYYWGDDEAKRIKPNLAGCNVEVRWYKHPGRGLTVTMEMSPDDWAEWLSGMLKLIRSADIKIP